MKITGEKSLGNFLKIFLQICFYLGIVILIALPFVLQILGFGLGASMYIIYPNGIVLLIIIYEFIKLFDSLRLNNPFCINNVKIIKTTSIVSLIGAFFWLTDFLYELILAKSENIMFYAILLFLFVLFLGVSIALCILSELFRQASEYKEENDLTI